MKILVVEDDSTSAKLMLSVLSSEGHSVECVDSAKGAIKVIERAMPHCILLDLALPGVDGTTLARQLKLNSDTRDIAIIAITAYFNVWSRRDMDTLGCAAYLVKPVRLRILCCHIAEIAGRRFDDRIAMLNP